MAGMLKYSNFARTTLAEDLTDVETGIDVTSAAAFPATGDFMIVVWEAGFSSPLNCNHEIMKVTAVSTNTFTATRAQESTTNIAWDTGDMVALVLTTSMMDEVEDQIGVQGSNLLFNASFIDMTVLGYFTNWLNSAGLPTFSALRTAGTHGPYSCTIANASGAAQTFYQLLQLNPDYTTAIAAGLDDYGVAVWGQKTAGAGNVTAVFGTVGAPEWISGVFTGSLVLHQGTLKAAGGASLYFGVAIDNGVTAVIELPTVSYGKNAPIPRIGLRDAQAYASGVGGYSAVSTTSFELATANLTTVFPIAILPTATAGTIGIKIYFSSITENKAGVLEACSHLTAGGATYGTYLSASSNASNAYAAIAAAAGKMSIEMVANNYVIHNQLGSTARCLLHRFWG